ncbi:hypothetical protein DIPPA_22556, partial [Diplonema papillatum]
MSFLRKKEYVLQVVPAVFRSNLEAKKGEDVAGKKKRERIDKIQAEVAARFGCKAMVVTFGQFTGGECNVFECSPATHFEDLSTLLQLCLLMRKWNTAEQHNVIVIHGAPKEYAALLAVCYCAFTAGGNLPKIFSGIVQGATATRTYPSITRYLQWVQQQLGPLRRGCVVVPKRLAVRLASIRLPVHPYHGTERSDYVLQIHVTQGNTVLQTMT